VLLPNSSGLSALDFVRNASEYLCSWLHPMTEKPGLVNAHDCFDLGGNG